MGFKEEQFEKHKAELIAEGFSEEELSQCDRCYRVEPLSELTKRHESLYCECCYDDLFVTWEEAFRRVK